MKFPVFKANSTSSENLGLRTDGTVLMNEGVCDIRSSGTNKQDQGNKEGNEEPFQPQYDDQGENGDGKSFINSHKCQVCDRTFKSYKELYKHQQILHKEIFPTLCQVCGKQFNTYQRLQKHMSIHSDERFQCTICGVLIKDYGNLKRHNISVHTQVKSFQCSFCGYKFNRKDLLKTHMKSVHENGKRLIYEKGPDNLYHCKVCDKGFKHGYSLSKHMPFHSDKKSFHCTICGQFFKYRTSLKKHMKSIHNGSFPYKCSACPKKFLYQCYLKSHQLRIHDNVYQFSCDICDKKFKWKKSLINHLESHLANKLNEESPHCQKKLRE